MPNEYGGTVHGAPSTAKHQLVIDLFRDWAANHENKRAFVRPDEISTYQVTLIAFIQHAEAAVTSIKGQTLGASRFSDSISAAEQLIVLAKDKRKFFDDRFMAMGRESNTFAKVMTFDEQRMVPQSKELGSITAKIDQLKAHDRSMTELTPSQAWALVAADTKGTVNEFANCERAIARLREFNTKWNTNYGMCDLAKTFRYMVSNTRMATQYRIEQSVGQQQGMVGGGTPLYKLLMASGFKNVWETGTSQASNDLSKRGAIEEQMGYGAAVRRTGGRAQDYGDTSSTFDPRNARGESTVAEMPRYAATIAQAQQSGVAKRYGTSYIEWKESIRQRVTWTPGDSWSMGGEGPESVKSYVSLEHPEAIFVHADENLLRTFMAEATGQDTVWLQQAQQNHSAMAAGGAYIETQIHGELTWNDVAGVVLDPTLADLATIRRDFDTFKRTKGYTFTVRTTTGA